MSSNRKLQTCYNHGKIGCKFQYWSVWTDVTQTDYDVGFTFSSKTTNHSFFEVRLSCRHHGTTEKAEWQRRTAEPAAAATAGGSEWCLLPLPSEPQCGAAAPGVGGQLCVPGAAAAREWAAPGGHVRPALPPLHGQGQLRLHAASNAPCQAHRAQGTCHDHRFLLCHSPFWGNV